ncbi:MAG: RNA helicase [Chaenotheca gracillima]|nr:MAG: RNA helicase [Chaenotheca gracillima]
MHARREPFAPLDVGRLQALESAKNLQNGRSNARGSGKRSFLGDITPLDHIENVDPTMTAKPSKRTKGLDGTTINKLQNLAKDTNPAQNTLKPAKSVVGLSRSIKVPVSRTTKIKSTGQLYTRKIDAVTSATIGSPAGRSPKNKRIGALKPSRSSLSPFTRVNPPTFLGGNGGSSIDAAISGTFSVDTAFEEAPLKVLGEKSQPKGWFFDIREDTLDETLTNIMEHSTTTLDISDDEGRDKAKELIENKENICPADAFVGALVNNAGPTMIHRATTEIRAPTKQQKKRKVNPFYRAPLADIPVGDLYGDGDSFMPAGNTSGASNALAATAEQWPLAEPTFEGFGTNKADCKGKAVA